MTFAQNIVVASKIDALMQFISVYGGVIGAFDLGKELKLMNGYELRGFFVMLKIAMFTRKFCAS